MHSLLLQVIAVTTINLKSISQRLWLSEKTVQTHVRHILQKLRLPPDTAYNRRVQAVLTYLQNS